MTERPRTREHIRTVERILAIVEAHGLAVSRDMHTDIEAVLRIEYLTHQRALRSCDERWRRRRDRGAEQPTSGA